MNPKILSFLFLCMLPTLTLKSAVETPTADTIDLMDFIRQKNIPKIKEYIAFQTITTHDLFQLIYPYSRPQKIPDELILEAIKKHTATEKLVSILILAITEKVSPNIIEALLNKWTFTDVEIALCAQKQNFNHYEELFTAHKKISPATPTETTVQPATETTPKDTVEKNIPNLTLKSAVETPTTSPTETLAETTADSTNPTIEKTITLARALRSNDTEALKTYIAKNILDETDIITIIHHQNSSDEIIITALAKYSEKNLDDYLLDDIIRKNKSPKLIEALLAKSEFNIYTLKKLLTTPQYKQSGLNYLKEHPTNLTIENLSSLLLNNQELIIDLVTINELSDELKRDLHTRLTDLYCEEATNIMPESRFLDINELSKKLDLHNTLQKRCKYQTNRTINRYNAPP